METEEQYRDAWRAVRDMAKHKEFASFEDVFQALGEHLGAPYDLAVHHLSKLPVIDNDSETYVALFRDKPRWRGVHLREYAEGILAEHEVATCP